MQIIIIIATIILVGNILFLGYYFLIYSKKNSGQSISDKEAIEKAKILANSQIQSAKERARQIQAETDSSLSTTRQSLNSTKEELQSIEDDISKRESQVLEQQKRLQQKEHSIESIQSEIEKRKVTLDENLKKIAEIDVDELRNEVEKDVQKDIESYKEKQVINFLDSLKLHAEEVAEEYIEEILPAAAFDYSGDSTNSHIEVENEGFITKFRGKDDENINKLIELTNVEINTEGMSRDGKRHEIHISSLDTIRREVATRVVLKAIKSSKLVTPDWIEQQVTREKKTLLKDVKEAGEFACRVVGLEDLPEKLKISVGKCKYRFSYGQNLLRHNIEMARLGQALAIRLGGDIHISKVACFLHDIGKVEPDETIPHHHISAELVKEHYNDSEVLYNAIIAHHFDVDAEYIESHIVRIADSISGARPGARRNSIEEYIEKVKALNEIAGTYAGVNQVQVMNGAREVRVIVNPGQVDDEATTKLSENIAEEIEDKLNYPGSIKVNAIRINKASAKSGS